MKAIKKSIEKIILCVLASMMVIVMTGNSAFAAGTSETETPPTLQEMRSYLLSIGTEEEFLNDIDENRIEKLYWTCVGKEVSFVGYEKEIVEIQDGDPRLRGQIATSKLQLGMAVYEFTANGGTIVSHVGIYVGDGMMIHCGDPIQYTSINSAYWQEHFLGFGRLP